MRAFLGAALLLAWQLCAAGSADPPAGAAAPQARDVPLLLDHGRFKDVRIYRPTAPASVALLLSGSDGWTPAADAMAGKLLGRGALVVGIDLAKFMAVLEADGDSCESPDGDLENLSHFVQAYVHAPTYMVPVLVGVASGASFAYAMLAQAPRNTFAAGLGLGFCPALSLQKPLCRGSGFAYSKDAHGRGVDFQPATMLANPFVALQGDSAPSCSVAAIQAFSSQVRGTAVVPLAGIGRDLSPPARWLPALAAAYDKLAGQNPGARLAAAPASLADLPVVEVPARGSAASDVFAIIMSGDGGWAGLDQDVAAALTANGIPVVGLDSLRYYWTARTPQGLAADTDRMIRYYLDHFGKRRVLLIGYSQGADVLPFAVNRLPPASRARVALTAVMGMSEHALFEFHLTSWVSDDNSGPATLPEINRITGMPVLCIYGEDETDSLCPKLDPHKFDIVKLKGGHHFDGDYANLAKHILSAAARSGS
jgi:type IV secretory pathway VirJ component